MYAQWTVKGTRTLKFATDDGSYISPVIRKYGETISLEEYVPQKMGYIFKGWYSDVRDKENRVTEYTFTEDDVLYAKWEANPNEEQPDTLMTTDTIYLTDEEYAERVNRLKAIMNKIMKRYIKRTEGGPTGSPFSASWRGYYGK